MSLEVTKEMRGRAYMICRDYLNGSWKKISADEMTLNHISGGLSNHLFSCSLPNSISPLANEPSKVLVRFYGQVHGEGALESLLAESVIFALLSERGLGPALYGVFPGGRLEEYIPARSLTTAELAEAPLSRQVATRMAQMHALNVPISKEPTWMWNCIKRWTKSSGEFLRSSSTEFDHCIDSRPSLLEKLRQYDFEAEISHLRRTVSAIASPVVFAHNDMQEGNILIKETTEIPRISLIDFEYCSYNYRGFDIANHFCEWIYSYKLPRPPYFTVERDDFPSKQQQLIFIRTYLHTYEIACGRKCSVRTSAESNGKLSFEPEDLTEMSSVLHPTEEKVLQEVRVFCLASHLFWALWSVVQAHVSKIPFGFLEYAIIRMEHYAEAKRQLRSEDFFKRKSEHLITRD